MKILEIKTEGFKVPDAVHAFDEARPGGDARSHAPSDTIVVVGPPGSGKSVFLRLVAAAKEALAPYGSPPDLRRLLRSGRATGKLTATFVLSDAEMARIEAQDREVRVVVEVEPSGSVCAEGAALRPALAPPDGAPPMTRWELFPAHRRLQIEDWETPHAPLSASIEAGRRLRSDGGKYAVLRRVFFDLLLAQATEIARALDSQGVALLGEEADRFAPYKVAVAAMAPDLRLASVELRAGSAVPVFLRRSGERLPIFELTASEEQAVLFAFASVWLGLTGAIVLVDGPELHVASREQAPFVERLLSLGRGNQTFLATGSAAIAALPGALLVDLGRPAGARATSGTASPQWEPRA